MNKTYYMEREFFIMPPDGNAGVLFEKDLKSQLDINYVDWQEWAEVELEFYFKDYNNIKLGRITSFGKIESEILPANWHMMFTHKSLALNNKVLMMVEIYYGPQKPDMDEVTVHRMYYPKIPV